jgi:hypothetical protein
MRSRSKVDVAEVAVVAGRRRTSPVAAGALAPGDLAEAMAKVLEKLDSLSWMDS